MEKIVCFGEIMMRLNPEGYLRLVQADRLMVSFAGGEANVAVSLANYGKDVSFVTKIPDHEIGQACVNELRRFGVDTSKIIRGGKRLGIYFVEKGASQRGSKVIYDRENSAIALADPSEFDWKKIFDGVCWFHFTGITPALSDKMAAACEEACKTAKEMGIRISCDLNYRKKLWTREKAGQVMSGLMKYVDVCIANEEDAADVFGIKSEDTDVVSGKLSKEGYIQVAETLSKRFGCKEVAITLRTSISANDNQWAGMLYREGQTWCSKEYLIHIVDRVGGGDAFGGGLIYSELEGMEPQDVIEFAVAASCLKQSIEFDMNQVSVAEVNALMKGNATGRVQR
jgi:2-dehydro-3-deoxygluconokinase